MTEAEPDVEPPAPLRVLIADDQAVIRAGFATILGAQRGIAVVGEAADGREAVRLARELSPDVIVMDVRMPVLDGIAATEALAGPAAKNPAPRVLVVTTFDYDHYVYDALRAGASGFMLKDSTPTQLVDAVRTVAAGDAVIAPAMTRALLGRFAERVIPTSPPSEDPRLAALTPRELDVFLAMANGDSNAEIATALVISRETVKTYVSRILLKLELRDRVQAVVYAHRNGLVGPGS